MCTNEKYYKWKEPWEILRVSKNCTNAEAKDAYAKLLCKTTNSGHELNEKLSVITMAYIIMTDLRKLYFKKGWSECEKVVQEGDVKTKLLKVAKKVVFRKKRKEESLQKSGSLKQLQFDNVKEKVLPEIAKESDTGIGRISKKDLKEASSSDSSAIAKKIGEGSHKTSKKETASLKRLKLDNVKEKASPEIAKDITRISKKDLEEAISSASSAVAKESGAGIDKISKKDLEEASSSASSAVAKERGGGSHKTSKKETASLKRLKLYNVKEKASPEIAKERISKKDLEEAISSASSAIAKESGAGIDKISKNDLEGASSSVSHEMVERSNTATIKTEKKKNNKLTKSEKYMFLTMQWLRSKLRDALEENEVLKKENKRLRATNEINEKAMNNIVDIAKSTRDESKSEDTVPPIEDESIRHEIDSDGRTGSITLPIDIEETSKKETKIYSCRKCDRVYKNLRGWSRHKKACHDSTENITAPIEIEGTSKMERKVFPCRKCNHPFNFISGRSRHEKDCGKTKDIVATRIQRRKFECRKCGSVFNFQSNRSRHEKNCSGKYELK